MREGRDIVKEALGSGALDEGKIRLQPPAEVQPLCSVCTGGNTQRIHLPFSSLQFIPIQSYSTYNQAPNLSGRVSSFVKSARCFYPAIRHRGSEVTQMRHFSAKQ